MSENWRNAYNARKRAKLEIDEHDFPNNVPHKYRWSFYCHYKSHRDDKVNHPTATFLWVIAEDQEDAIMKAEEQVKNIPGGRLGYMLRGFLTMPGAMP